MGLKDIDIRREYRTKASDIVREFMLPVLTESIEYDRAVGFFSSSSFAEIAKGLGRIARKGGVIRLVASPELSEEDVNAINEGYRKRGEINGDLLREKVLELFESDDGIDEVSRNRLSLLASLVAAGTLDIRIAFAVSDSGFGIFHEKLGILTDENGDRIAFSGSMNETANAMHENYEAVDVFRSWDDPEGRVGPKVAAFEAIWNDDESGVKTFDFPEVKDKIVRRFLRKPVDLTDDLAQDETDVWSDMPALPKKTPHVPEEYTLRNYQVAAADEWRRHGYRGIFDMATGTGKTVTALAALTKLSDELCGKLAEVIVCPYQHLVSQWVEDIRLFGMDPIIGYSGSPQRDWERRLDDAILDQRLGVSGAEFFCFVCTNGTYATDRVQEKLGKISARKLLIVDEAHNVGAVHMRTLLREDFDYRLGLSATIERFRDEAGTERLFEYFGDRCIEYTLGDAIYGNKEKGLAPCLTQYEYHPVVVYLEDDELEDYEELSKAIAKAMRKGRDGKLKMSPTAEKLALKRARLVAAARQKLTVLEDRMRKYANDDFILVYCGATKVAIDGSEEFDNPDEYERRQIDLVTDILGNGMDMRVRQFTSRENSAEREEIKELYSDGIIQALIAIKCLDEGVNIPNIKTAFILASTTNPREYVQRRGRLLRRAPGKEYAEIYDFITLPRSADEAARFPDEGITGEKRLVANELLRAREFASLAKNLTRTLDEIEEGFFSLAGLDGFLNDSTEV